jgi:hypothetical protein
LNHIRCRNYNPELDRQDKIREMRALYKAMNEGKSKEEPDEGFAESVSDKVSAYFEWEKTRNDSATTFA